MAQPFDYPPENMTGILDLFSHANGLTGGFLGTGILVVIAVISLISTKSYSSEKSFGFAGFITLLSAIFLRFLNLISDGVLYVVIVSFVGILIWLFFTREQETI